MTTRTTTRHSNTRSSPGLGGECVIDLADQGIRIPASAQTFRGFCAWAASPDFPKRGRLSFLNREIHVDMSPEEIETHNKVNTEVTRVVANLNQELDLGELYGDRVWLRNDTVELSTEADATFALWKSLETGPVRSIPHEDHAGEYMLIEGSPDWVLEIVSWSSVRKDKRVLPELYHRAGISEYWLIDARGDALDFRILQSRPAGFVAANRRGGWQRSRVFGQVFRLERSRGRLNRWEYQLLVQAARP